ncbi:CDGSH iron-sulfur domain-containing protein [Gemmobacter denitrificans]|uniref:CDGSH iron-sulfur domain-containing protein n=1 Tax=Gemmobacter denitrificans TaxID=3123040 RepID=A0ABU8BST4_9RHOB
MTDTPEIAQKAPFKVELEEGKTYFWCSCGRSQKQPYCDGSHKGTSLSPVKFVAEATKTAFLCGCKHSAKSPFCDGAHKAL